MNLVCETKKKNNILSFLQQLSCEMAFDFADANERFCKFFVSRNSDLSFTDICVKKCSMQFLNDLAGAIAHPLCMSMYGINSLCWSARSFCVTL